MPEAKTGCGMTSPSWCSRTSSGAEGLGIWDWARLTREAADLGVSLDAAQTDMLRRYVELLREWNQRLNLAAIERPEEILVKHLLDSLSCAKVLSLDRSRSLIDVGTGAGFPGLVLKIAYPNLRVTLLDAVRK